MKQPVAFGVYRGRLNTISAPHKRGATKYLLSLVAALMEPSNCNPLLQGAPIIRPLKVGFVTADTFEELAKASEQTALACTDTEFTLYSTAKTGRLNFEDDDLLNTCMQEWADEKLDVLIIDDFWLHVGIIPQSLPRCGYIHIAERLKAFAISYNVAIVIRLLDEGNLTRSVRIVSDLDAELTTVPAGKDGVSHSRITVVKDQEYFFAEAAFKNTTSLFVFEANNVTASDTEVGFRLAKNKFEQATEKGEYNGGKPTW